MIIVYEFCGSSIYIIDTEQKRYWSADNIVSRYFDTMRDVCKLSKEITERTITAARNRLKKDCESRHYRSYVIDPFILAWLGTPNEQEHYQFMSKRDFIGEFTNIEEMVSFWTKIEQLSRQTASIFIWIIPSVWRASKSFRNTPP